MSTFVFQVISATQARLAYLTQLGEVISYGARSYTATMMLQDREVLVSLLVGAKYGLSQVINHKLNMISTLVEFSSISRVELLSDDSDDSTDDDDPMDSQSYKGSDPASTDWEERRREEEEKRKEEERKEREEHKGKQEVKIIVTREGKENESEEEVGATGSGLRKFNVVDEEMNLETSWYHTDPRVTSSFSSLSSSSLSTALDESSAAAKAPCRLDAFRGSSPGEDPSNLDVHHPYLLETKRQGPLRPTNLNYCGNDNSFLCFADLSKADFLPSPAGATSDDDDDDDDEEEEDLGIHKLRCISKIPSSRDLRMIDSTPFERLPIKRKKKTPPKVPVRTSSIPGNKSAQAEHRLSKDADGLFLTPSPNPKPALLLKDNVSESEDEFFDAQERFTPPVPELSGTKLAVPPPVPPKPTSSCSFHPLSLPSSSPVSPTDPNKGIFKDTVGTPNGIHPWSNRNGSIQSGPRRVSLSHESLSPKNTDVPLTIATSPTSVDCKGVGVFDSRESGRSGSGSDLRTSSSSLGGRLPASALRGKIQSLPWYMTRSQEILGNLDYPSTSSINGDTSGFGSGLSVASGLSDLNKTPVKDKETIASKSGSKGSILDDGAEVVIATIKEAPELSSHMKKASGTNGSHPNLSFRDNSPHLGSVSSEQPQSRPHSAVGLGGVTSMQIGGDSPTSSGADTTPPQHHRESCGCRTVYANCFSGDTEDGVSFDEELTVYEFSRRICPKPAQASSPTIPSPKPNILSLLRDNPRPLGRLRSLTNKNYGGLRGGFVSLREDIDKLLLVLEKGVLDQSQHPSKLENTDLNHNGTEVNTAAGKGCTGISPVIMTESERSLLQAEARRLASGCQRATRVGWAPDEALRSLTTSFSALVQLSAACLKTNPCPGCDVCHKARLADSDEDDDGQQPMDKLKEIVGLYREFVGAVETAGTGGVNSGRSVGSGQSQGEEDGVRLLAKRCTLLISSVFALTQLFRTCTLETTETPGRVPLNF
ncbi:hypothetical protein GOODEAATRI_002994 [Goodea atripinnis]|uniref:Uncharacterized protein n=1 Tax=Goodea atripinnis TaxID=208336 RepID=A0ABV0P2K7_9TELE